MAVETEEQTEMWPEINMSKPKEKAAFLAAKRYAKAKADRDAVLTDNKKKVDAARERLIAAMHEADMKKFRWKNVEAEIYEQTEKVTVKIGGERESEGGDDGDEE